MSIVDLHIHSKYSDDAEYAVNEIMEMAKVKGIKMLSISDHNSVQANKEAVVLGKKMGIAVIAGIEIDCAYQGVNLHLLGYNIDCADDRFVLLEEELYRKGMDAFLPMIENINKLGIKVDAEEVMAVAGGKAPCGEHIAEVVLHKSDAVNCELLRPYLPGGIRSDMPYINFYWDYFSQGAPAHAPMEYMTLQSAIKMVKETGGVTVIAHPGANLKENMVLIDEIIDCGIEGIEVYNNYHTPEQMSFLHSKAKERNLFFTCGSDFHGKNKPKISIGQCDCDYEDFIMEKMLKYSC